VSPPHGVTRGSPLSLLTPLAADVALMNVVSRYGMQGLGMS